MNRIITDKVKALKALARQGLKNHWQEAILFTLVVQLIKQLPPIIYSMLPGTFDKMGIIAMLINLYSFIITGPVTISLCSFFIKMFRQEGPYNFSHMSYGFKIFPKSMILYLRIMIFTWLWSLLFIIPGIIAAINYSQAFFIMADDPTKSPAKCMYESKFIMQGNRLKYCTLLFSLVGWYILASLPSLICQSVLQGDAIMALAKSTLSGTINAQDIYSITSNPIVDILTLLTCVVATYWNSAKAVFFDLLIGKIVIQNVEEFQNVETVNI